jgi:signal transduction histidine kinase
MSLGRFGLAGKLDSIFAGLIVAGIAAVATIGVSLVALRADARRLLEEGRELRLTTALIDALKLLDSEPLSRSRATGRLDLALSNAGRALTDFMEGAGEADPSLGEHQAEEDELVLGIRAALRDLDAWNRGEPGSPDEEQLARLVQTSHALAEELGEETRLEAVQALRHLERGIRRVTTVAAVSLGGSLVVLLAGFLLVHRQLVRPVRSLSEGTRRLAEGHLDQRVPVETEDEIGELAREFNAMAERLAQTHRDLERRVEERTRQFLHASRLAGVGTLAAGIAHEVNTPLATIASCAEGLERRIQNGSLDRETELEYLKMIASESYRARDITARMLVFARRDPGGIERQALEPMLREAPRILERAFDERGVRLEIEVTGGLPPVDVNRSELEQALLNLLKNALEATPRGGTVKLSARSEPRGIVIDVLDQGPGVPPEHRAAVFDPFFTTKEPGKGTGLGLSLVFGIVERHGGTVELLDRASGGALFRVVLPVAATEAPS